MSSRGLDGPRLKTAVLIGSGPSLNRIDIGRLSAFNTIAFNRSWLAWRDWGFSPRFYACLDPLTMNVIGPELPGVVASHPQTHFFLHDSAASYGLATEHNVSLCAIRAGVGFRVGSGPLTDYGNVGAMSVQLLHGLGCESILMVGVDGYQMPRDKEDVDINHFRDDYGRGRIALTPELCHRYSDGWRDVAVECRRVGLSVRNASPGTALTCIETTEFEQGLAWLSAASVEPVAKNANRRTST